MEYEEEVYIDSKSCTSKYFSKYFVIKNTFKLDNRFGGFTVFFNRHRVIISYNDSLCSSEMCEVLSHLNIYSWGAESLKGVSLNYSKYQYLF